VVHSSRFTKFADGLGAFVMPASVRGQAADPRPRVAANVHPDEAFRRGSRDARLSCAWRRSKCGADQRAFARYHWVDVPLGTDFSTSSANSQSSPIPYSGTLDSAPCSTQNAGSATLPSFDGGGITLSTDCLQLYRVRSTPRSRRDRHLHAMQLRQQFRNSELLKFQ
jgi:hypothetical protein